MATIETRKRKDGTSKYRVKIRVQGFEPIEATFDRLTDAKRWAQGTESKIRTGRYIAESLAEKYTVNDLIDRYEHEIMPRKAEGTKQNQVMQLRWWKSEIGALQLSKLTPAVISQCKGRLAIDSRGVRRSEATVRHYLAPLSHALSVAKREWLWIENNPIEQVQRPRVSNARNRYLSDDERERLLEACRIDREPLLYPIVLIGLTTGARRSEILGLRRQDVDLKNRYFYCHGTKNGDSRRLRIADPVLTLLEKLLCEPGRPSDYVFHRSDATKQIGIRAAWERARARAGITNYRFHDNRHTAASYLAMTGSTHSELAAVLGHRSLSMVKRYAHINEQHSAKVIDRMTTQVFGVNWK